MKLATTIFATALLMASGALAAEPGKPMTSDPHGTPMPGDSAGTPDTPITMDDGATDETMDDDTTADAKAGKVDSSDPHSTE